MANRQPATNSEVVALGGVASFATGWQHNCALLNNGEVRCWGRNQRGQTAPSSPALVVATPTAVDFGPGAKVRGQRCRYACVGGAQPLVWPGMPTQGTGRGAGRKKGHDTIIGTPKAERRAEVRGIDSPEDDAADASAQNPTVMKQAAALLEEVLAQAGGSLEDIGEMDPDPDPDPPEDAEPEDSPGQNPTVVKQAGELLELALLQAGGSLDEIGELDESPAPLGIESSFPDEVDDEESHDEPLIAPSAFEADLSPPDDWAQARPHEPEGEPATPDPAVEDLAGRAPKSKKRIVTRGWLVGAVAAVGVGVGVSYFAAKLSKQPATETAPAVTAAPREPVAPPAQTESAESAAPEPVASAPTAAPSASLSAEPSPSGSVADPARPASLQPVIPRRPYRPPPAPVPRRRGNLEDIYE